MPNQKNIDTVEKLKTNVSKAKSIVFADYHGLTAQSITELRAKLGEVDSEASVGKNTLVKIALKENNYDDPNMENFMKGPTLTVFSYEDPVAGVKALFEFSSSHEDLPNVKAGIIDGRFTNLSDLKTLSNLPSRDELIAKVVGGMKSPLFGIVNTLGGVQRNFVYVLSAVAEKKKEEEVQ